MNALKFGSKGFYRLIAKRLDDLLPVTLQSADWDDLRQEALCRVLQYRKSHLTSAFVRACVDRSVRQWRRNKKREPLELNGDDGLIRNEVRQGKRSELDCLYLRIDLEKVQQTLTSQQMQICEMLTSGKAVRRIAKHLHVPHHVIRAEINAVRQKIEQAGYAN